MLKSRMETEWFSIHAVFLRQSEKNRCEKKFCQERVFFITCGILKADFLSLNSIFSFKFICIIYPNSSFDSFLIIWLKNDGLEPVLSCFLIILQFCTFFLPVLYPSSNFCSSWGVLWFFYEQLKRNNGMNN